MKKLCILPMILIVCYSFLFAQSGTQMVYSAAQIRLLQEKLLEVGRFYAGGPVTGDAVLPEITMSALKAFQKKVGIPITGKADDITLVKLGINIGTFNKLNPASSAGSDYRVPSSGIPSRTVGEHLPFETTTQRDMMGSTYETGKSLTKEQINLLQRNLVEVSHFYAGEPVEIGGDLPSITLAALKAFQKKSNLPADGRITDATLDMLGINPTDFDSMNPSFRREDAIFPGAETAGESERIPVDQIDNSIESEHPKDSPLIPESIGSEPMSNAGAEEDSTDNDWMAGVDSTETHGVLGQESREAGQSTGLLSSILAITDQYWLVALALLALILLALSMFRFMKKRRMQKIIMKYDIERNRAKDAQGEVEDTYDEEVVEEEVEEY